MVRYVDAPSAIFEGPRRHLVFLAHFDDETPYVGLLSRLSGHVDVAWLTNGDGLAYQAKEDPQVYAAKRKEESLCAMEKLGIARDRLHFLDVSEIEIYRNFVHLPGSVSFFFNLADKVHELIEELSPDVLWVLAFQGGQPEHDLSHLLAVRSARRLGVEEVYELPEYEYTILLPFRFRPWLNREVFRIQLTGDEYLLKQVVIKCFPSQQGLIDAFLKVVRALSWLGRPFKGNRGFDEFLKTEVFAPVPPDRDYTSSPHIHEVFDYMFDDYKGKPIRFSRTLGLLSLVLSP